MYEVNRIESRSADHRAARSPVYYFYFAEGAKPGRLVQRLNLLNDGSENAMSGVSLFRSNARRKSMAREAAEGKPYAGGFGFGRALAAILLRLALRFMRALVSMR